MSNTFRIIILGAGFSHSAGLPLGSELFREVRQLAARKYGRDNSIEVDIRRYINYINITEGKRITDDSLDYEKFLGFLDVEHFLRFYGGDTLSDEGNSSQFLVRHGIAEILYQKTPKIPPALYRAFVGRLNATDWVFTFNYDTLLESALEAEGIPYRLFPHRFSEIGWSLNVVDESKEEVVLLKLHGSIDWYDRAVYERKKKTMERCSVQYEIRDPVFGNNRVVEPVQITDGPRGEDDPLAKVYRVRHLEPLFESDILEFCPLLLTPSQTKMLYISPLRDFWSGIYEVGGHNLSICVIGYSLPAYDEYARQGFFRMFRNYTNYLPDLQFQGRKKTPIRILDYGSGEAAENGIRRRYSFVEQRRTEINLEGLNESTIEWIFPLEDESPGGK